jgi:hypothetical protein
LRSEIIADGLPESGVRFGESFARSRVAARQ